MKKVIAELNNGDMEVELEARVIDVGEERTVTTKFGQNRLKEYTLKDESGEIKLTLWGDKANMLRMDDDVHIKGAVVTEFKQQLQLGVPKKGHIEVRGFEPKKDWVE